MPEAKTPRNASPWIKAFVAFHVVCITMWSLPYPKKPYMNGTAKLGVDTSSPRAFARSFSETVTEGILYWNWQYMKNGVIMYYPGITGFWQYWDMFSPNPASVDLYMEADVKYKNGTTYRFHYPRIYTMPIPQKYLKERYRKFYENVNQDTQAAIRPAVAQRIALECFKDPNNPPMQVTLIRFYDTIEPPGAKPDPAYTEYRFFTYIVDQAKLKSDKRLEN
jgi:hypothetical protein